MTVVAVIRDLREELGFCPTFDEVAKRLDVSTVTATRTIRELKGMGLVSWEPGKPRTLHIVD